MQIENFYKQFCREEYDENGVLSRFEPVVPDGFNFAYDVVDKIAALEPDRRAMVWCDMEGEERFFTFDDMRRYSNKAANLFAKQGVKKGDMVMLVLKRHYQFWFAVLALHKLGAVGVPATNLLTVKDYVYRFNAASIARIITAKYWHNIPADGLHLTVSETGWAKSVRGKLYGISLCYGFP